MAILGGSLSVFALVAVMTAPREDQAYARPLATASVTDVSSGGGTGGNQVRVSATDAKGTDRKPKSSATGESTTTAKTGTAGSTTTPTDTTTGAAIAKPAPAPAPAATTPAGTWKYPLHTGIKTTYFWAGEEAGPDNDFIQNISSAWQSDWKSYFGGTDDPSNRCGYNPCGFTPKENPFYFALPWGDYTESGQVSNMHIIPWYAGAVPNGQSIIKNRWIQITAAPDGVSKTVYAQWEDVGPFNWTDGGYVFGTSTPASNRAGLDVSPAVRDYLGANFRQSGSTVSSWRFVDFSEVPAGPWKSTITTSGPDWN
jgi:hypothetical protein